MITLPNPFKYEDPIRYFRDSHAIILSAIDRFARLVSQARESGVSASFASTNDWDELLNFLVLTAPIHELDEEGSLFPVILEKVPLLGFNSSRTPSRFIHEQHKVMQERSKGLLSLWHSFHIQHTLTPEEESRFLVVAEALIKLYHDHITQEDALIYTFANDTLLSPTERIAIMVTIKNLHSNRSMTQYLDFEPSGITTNTIASEDTEAVSDSELNIDEDSEEEDKAQGLKK